MARDGQQGTRIIVCWSNWGEYHFARLRQLTDGTPADWEVNGLELFKSCPTYDWDPQDVLPSNFASLDLEGDTSRNPRLGDVPKLNRYLKEKKPTHVFVTSYRWMSLLILALSRAHRAKVIMMNETLESTARPGWHRRKFKQFLARVFDGAFVGGSPHVRYYSSLGFDEATMTTGYDVVDDEFFRQQASIALNSNQRLAPTSSPYILSIGRFAKIKRLDLLLRAYAQVHQGHGDVALVIAGYGPEKERLITLSRELGLATTVDGLGRSEGLGDVYFIPKVTPIEAANLYAYAHVFALCSESEPWGLVINEALACNTPVVCSDIVGCAEDLVVGYDDSSTFKNGDLQSLVVALDEQLSKGTKQRELPPRPLNSLKRFSDGATDLVERV